MVGSALQLLSWLSRQPSPIARADPPTQRIAAQREESRSEPELPEDVKRIGPQPDPRPYFVQFRSLLVNRRVDAGPL